MPIHVRHDINASTLIRLTLQCLQSWDCGNWAGWHIPVVVIQRQQLKYSNADPFLPKHRRSECTCAGPSCNPCFLCFRRCCRSVLQTHRTCAHGYRRLMNPAMLTTDNYMHAHIPVSMAAGVPFMPTLIVSPTGYYVVISFMSQATLYWAPIVQ